MTEPEPGTVPPRGARPWSRAILVEVPVSSVKTRFSGGSVVAIVKHPAAADLQTSFPADVLGGDASVGGGGDQISIRSRPLCLER